MSAEQACATIRKTLNDMEVFVCPAGHDTFTAHKKAIISLIKVTCCKDEEDEKKPAKKKPQLSVSLPSPVSTPKSMPSSSPKDVAKKRSPLCGEDVFLKSKSSTPTTASPKKRKATELASPVNDFTKKMKSLSANSMDGFDDLDLMDEAIFDSSLPTSSAATKKSTPIKKKTSKEHDIGDM